MHIASTNNLSCVTAYVLVSSSPDLNLANQEWLLSGPDVCLVTLTLQQRIVTKNTCFYGSNVVLHVVLLFAVAMQLRTNCFDDLFVPTDYGLMSISGVHCTVHVRSSIREPFGDLVGVCFHTYSPSSMLYGIVSDSLLSSSSMSGWMADTLSSHTHHFGGWNFTYRFWWVKFLPIIFEKKKKKVGEKFPGFFFFLGGGGGGVHHFCHLATLSFMVNAPLQPTEKNCFHNFPASLAIHVFNEGVR